LKNGGFPPFLSSLDFFCTAVRAFFIVWRQHLLSCLNVRKSSILRSYRVNRTRPNTKEENPTTDISPHSVYAGVLSRPLLMLEQARLAHAVKYPPTIARMPRSIPALPCITRLWKLSWPKHYLRSAARRFLTKNYCFRITAKNRPGQCSPAMRLRNRILGHADPLPSPIRAKNLAGKWISIGRGPVRDVIEIAGFVQ